MSNTDTTAAGASAAFIAPFIPLRTFVTKRPRTGKALPVQRKFSQARAQLASVSPSLSTADTPVPRDDLKSSSPQKDIHMESLSSLEWQAITKQVMIHVSTKQGRARIAPNGMLYIPSTRKESEALLRQTRELCNLEYTQCKPLSFTGVTDVSTNAIMAEKGRTLDGESIIEVAQLLSAARQTRRMIDSAENVPTLKALVETFRTWPNVEREITKCLDYFGVVQESADPQLRSIRTSLKSTGVEVRQKLNDIMARESDAIQDRVITTRYDRFVIPVKTSHKARFKRGTIHDASSTGNTVYIEPVSVKGLNDRLREQTARERARVNAVLRKLSEELVKPIADDLCHIVDVFAELDATAARSRCSRGFDGVDVEFDDHNPLFLFGVRHPLLSWKAMSDIRVEKANGKDIKESSDFLQAQLPEWKKRVVPSSYKLSKDIRCVCVTGPNTGGKTLSLKTLGVTVLLAKAGFFVPATIPSADGIDGEAQVARIPYFDSVLADIGDDQSLVQSLSTFSGHVRRIKRILTASTSKTLVLLDEIGSGTDPAEGAALGMSILRYLAIHRRAALTFATTHHGELKTLKYSKDDSAQFFENASVEFDDVQMRPTYRLVWGIPGRSNALAIAERLGLRDNIIEEARYLLNGINADGEGDENRVDIEKMISSLERDKNAAETAREGAERALRKVDAMKVELQERLERLRVSETELRKEQKAAMETEIREAKKQIARLIKEMQQGGGSAQSASRASEKLNSLLIPGSTPKKGIAEGYSGLTDVDELKVGDKIVVPRLGSVEMDVVEKLSKKEVLVSLGAMKAKVKVKEIAAVRHVQSPVSQAPQYERKEESRKQIAVRTAANSIDIRGERVEGAQVMVDKALDKALALGTLWVIHGHGTGRLRNGIRDFLQNHHLVERIQDAEQAEGGRGVTVTYLK